MFMNKYVIVRTYSAGVHAGTLKSFDASNRQVVLTDSRRIWSWEKAFTLSKIAMAGLVDARMSVELPEILVCEVIEIIPCTVAAEKTLRELEAHGE